MGREKVSTKDPTEHLTHLFLFSSTFAQRGKRVEGTWVFGGVERLEPLSKCEFHIDRGSNLLKPRKGCKHRAGKMFCTIVKDRKKRTLLPLIKKHIAPGTIIISDMWKAYDSIPRLKRHYYQHESVNHSKTFKDPITGACTNVIEGAWQSKCKSKIHVRNYQECFLEHYLIRRMWTVENRDRLWDEIWSVLSRVEYGTNLEKIRRSSGSTWRSPEKKRKLDSLSV